MTDERSPYTSGDNHGVQSGISRALSWGQTFVQHLAKNVNANSYADETDDPDDEVIDDERSEMENRGRKDYLEQFLHNCSDYFNTKDGPPKSVGDLLDATDESFEIRRQESWPGEHQTAQPTEMKDYMLGADHSRHMLKAKLLTKKDEPGWCSRRSVLTAVKQSFASNEPQEEGWSEEEIKNFLRLLVESEEGVIELDA